MNIRARERLPFFPLNIVVFPNEKVELYIFEPRYSELVHQCEENDHGFGIVPVLKEDILPYGTEVELLKVNRSAKDGTARITVRGKRIFQLFSFEVKMEGHLYSGGDVMFREEGVGDWPAKRDLFGTEALGDSLSAVATRKDNASVLQHTRLQKKVNTMFTEICDLLKQKGSFAFFNPDKTEGLAPGAGFSDSYSIAAQMIGLDLREKAELIAMDKEQDRLAFIYERMRALLVTLKDVLGT